QMHGRTDRSLSSQSTRWPSRGASPGLKLFDIKCAWFNEEEYCEFFPRTLYLFRDENVAENVAQRSKLKGKPLIKLVGAGRFELPTPCSRSKGVGKSSQSEEI